MKKVLLITNIPNPYRIPLFNEISKHFAAAEIHLKIIFGASGYKRRFFTIDPSEISYDFEILKDEAHTFSEDAEKSYFLYKGLGSNASRKSGCSYCGGLFSRYHESIFSQIIKGNTLHHL
ncbi:MAG: hypothetical protein IPL22_07750 [Bacteroidetes bacterium]|nr:hypothetical protein [Bacteroidota bacterium]